jgi:hypothetical protein
VIVGALVAVSFGGYATSLFVGEHTSGAWNNLFISILILAMLAVNLVGAKFVANAQSVIVPGVLGAPSRSWSSCSWASPAGDGDPTRTAIPSSWCSPSP